jgi:N,N'-diacetyllegionaminate synthase
MFKIGSRDIGADDLFFVVEEGQANLGDFSKAKAMIDAVSETGADAIEFQLARADDFYVKSDPGHAIYLKREFTEGQLAEIARYVREKGLEFLAVPLSHRLIEPLAKVGCSAFNINASDINNPDMIDAVAASGLPFFLSLPLATEKEIEWAIARISGKKAKNYALLHGQHIMASSGRPLNIEDTSLGFISTLKDRYGVPVGFIDHTPLEWGPAAAAAAGADIVTKHLAISRADKGPDWQVCLEPHTMKESVRWARDTKKSVSVRSKKLAAEENKDRLVMRRSIVAARNIKAGQVIKRQDIIFKRPGTGMSPSRYDELIGKAVRRDIMPDAFITEADIQGA